MKRKKELDKTIEFFSIYERKFCGRQGIGWGLEDCPGVFPMALSQVFHVSSWSDLGILTHSYPA